MPSAIIWGYMLIMQLPPMPAIIDPNFSAGDYAKCELIRSELKQQFPDYQIDCVPTWKPEKAPKVHRAVRHRRHSQAPSAPNVASLLGG